MNAEIQLTSGQICLVDVEWYDRLSQMSWTPSTHHFTTYAVNRQRYGQGRRHFRYMHRLIVAPLPGYVVDHINGNGLDNRVCNLRQVSRANNARNRAGVSNTSSVYKGVSFSFKRKHWTADITKDGKHIYLGSFDSQESAAQAYNEAALKHFGSFAKLNVINN
jgi:hypothetical protein